MLFQFSLYDMVGLSLVIFAGVWGFYGAMLLRRGFFSGAIIAAAAIAVLLVFVMLTASTPARRAYVNIDVRGIVGALLTTQAAVVIAGAAAILIYRVARRLAGKTINLLFAAAVSIGLVVVIAPVMSWLYLMTFEPDLDEVFTHVTSVEGVTIAENIPIRIFENEMVTAPTALELGPNNELYVAGAGGTIWMMEDADQNNVADRVVEFATGLQQPEGLAWGDDGLYINEEGRLIFIKDVDGDYVADETRVVLDGFPGEVYAFHQNNGLTFGPDGRLYIGSGSTTDHRPEEHPLAARILSINPDGTDLQVYATGLRNPYGLIPAPGGGFFAVDNGSSGCVDTDFQVNDCRQEVKIDVPEEVNYIVEGKDYGFPHYFGMPPADSDSMPPVVTFPEHSAPTGLVIYEGDKFPPRFRNQLYVSLWARGEIYRVNLHRIDDEHFVGAPILFASGLTGPSALLNAPDGGLYVTSYTGNAIYYIG